MIPSEVCGKFSLVHFWLTEKSMSVKVELKNLNCQTFFKFIKCQICTVIHPYKTICQSCDLSSVKKFLGISSLLLLLFSYIFLSQKTQHFWGFQMCQNKISSPLWVGLISGFGKFFIICVNSHFLIVHNTCKYTLLYLEVLDTSVTSFSQISISRMHFSHQYFPPKK